MTLRRPGWKSVTVAVAAAVVLFPGWRAHLVPENHDALLARAATSRTQTGVAWEGDRPGEQWHFQYLDSWPARMLDELGLRRWAPALAVPDFAAHIPPGEQRADGYFRVESEVHWPWWRPGGGIDRGSAGR